jgi:rubredoxin
MSDDDDHPWVGHSVMGHRPTVPNVDDSESVEEAVTEVEDNEPDPTHECSACGWEMYIESSPTADYQWCPMCEGVKRFVRLDRNT